MVVEAHASRTAPALAVTVLVSSQDMHLYTGLSSVYMCEQGAVQASQKNNRGAARACHLMCGSLFSHVIDICALVVPERLLDLCKLHRVGNYGVFCRGMGARTGLICCVFPAPVQGGCHFY